MARRALCLLVFAAGCYSGGDLVQGLAPGNPNDHGPQILWDPFAEPFPEIPFPNDIGTRPDNTSPTGRRVNVTTHAPTEHERRLRRLINTLDGFSTYAPIWLRLGGRVDVADLACRQAIPDANATPYTHNDAVYLVNLDPASVDYGQPVPLDFGTVRFDALGRCRDFAAGRFPATVERPGQYFANDPRRLGSNVVFETYREDVNDNGVLDAGEDTDFDGILDRPNVWGELLGDTSLMDPYRDLVTFYELETDTLLIRPIFPLAERTTYAVIVTRRVVGADTGSPVRPPFASINHVQQTAALRPLVEDGILRALGITLDDVAFTWSFTTQSITADVEAIRAGLYGQGPLARLASEFPPRLVEVQEVDTLAHTHNVHFLRTDRLLEVLENPTFLGGLGFDVNAIGPTAAAYRANIEGFAFVIFESPAFVENDDGAFRVDALSGRAEYGRELIPMVCAIPHANRGAGPPFPVVFYGHGYTSMRFEMLGFAASLGRFGLATCAIDAYHHGAPDSELVRLLAEVLLADAGLSQLADVIFNGRARDFNFDGSADSGVDFFTANTFHTRDVLRQSTIDLIQAVRVLRRFGKTPMPVDINGDGRDDVAGDFNGDGIADLGGDSGYFMMGQSLGGIMSTLAGAAEPAIRAAAPVSGGGGLTDLTTRSVQGGVVQAVFLPLLGPIIASRPVAGGVDLVFNQLVISQGGGNTERDLRFARVPDAARGELATLAAGDRVRVVNLANGEFDEVTLTSANAAFRLQLAADFGDRVVVELWRGGDIYRSITTFETDDLAESGFHGTRYGAGDSLRVLQEGFGLRRQSPDLRRLVSIAQMVVDPADPVNWAPLYSRPRPMRPDGAVPTSLLVVNTNGDMNVPVAAGASIGRAAGLINTLYVDPTYGKTQDQVLMDTRVLEGLESPAKFVNDPCHYETRAILFDVDDASNGSDPVNPPRLAQVVRPPQCPGPDPICAEPCSATPPLRLTRRYAHGMAGMRFLYLEPKGVHGFLLPDPGLPFDYNLYQINQIGWFFATDGKELVDDACLATPSCPFY